MQDGAISREAPAYFCEPLLFFFLFFSFFGVSNLMLTVYSVNATLGRRNNESFRFSLVPEILHK